MSKDWLIWWTTDKEAADVSKSVRVVPEYLVDTFNRRVDNGFDEDHRLWFPFDKAFNAESDEFELEWPSTQLGTTLFEESAGVVFRRSDLPLLVGLPGVITNFRLNLIKQKGFDSTGTLGGSKAATNLNKILAEIGDERLTNSVVGHINRLSVNLKIIEPMRVDPGGHRYVAGLVRDKAFENLSKFEAEYPTLVYSHLRNAMVTMCRRILENV